MLLWRQLQTWFACQSELPRNARERVNRAWVLYGFCPLFGRENCMSVYAAEFYGEGCTSRRRQKRRTVFAPRSNPRSFPLLANVRFFSISPSISISLFYPEDEYVLHMHSFINLCRDTASSDIRARVLKRSQETCLVILRRLIRRRWISLMAFRDTDVDRKGEHRNVDTPAITRVVSISNYYVDFC